jgi:hypothetical protein
MAHEEPKREQVGLEQAVLSRAATWLSENLPLGFSGRERFTTGFSACVFAGFATEYRGLLGLSEIVCFSTRRAIAGIYRNGGS